jgi:hypothetical protein
MKRSTLLAALLFTTVSVNAALKPGDIAFTAFNADEDGFAIVALRELAPYTTLHFSDNEWTGGAPGAGTFTTGENTFAWISGTLPLAAGSVVRFSAIDQAARAASVGAFGLVQSGTPGFSASGDTIFAFSADTAGAPTQFVAALSSEGFAGSSLAGTGLVAGVSAVAIGTGADFGEYKGVRSGLRSFGDYAGLINDASHWGSFASGDFAATVPNLTRFEIAPVPEPETYALLMTGLGLIGLRLKQRRSVRAPLALA